MIDGLKPYSAYKDSGVPWLGDVPEHWDVKRNKLFMHEVNDRSSDGAEELLTVSQYTGVTPRRERITDEGQLLTNASSLVGYKRVQPGDLVMNIMLAWNGSLGVSPVEGIASPAYCVFRATAGKVEPRFLHYLLRTPLFTGAFKTVSTGVVDSRLRLYPDVFFRLPSPLPPLSEQSAIVRFLDHADRRIRRYIRAKQKLIKLLEEQKQAIIHGAVTRGLDPNVRLKPSGVEWLGEVPEHWEVMPMRHLLSFGPKNGVSPPASSIGGVLSFSISAVREGCLRVAGNEKYVDLNAALVPSFSIRTGDILLVRGNGNVALVAKCGLVGECPEDCIYPDILMKLRPNAKMLTEFMVLAANSTYVSDQVPSLAKTTNGTFKVSGASVRSLVLAVPPRLEQETILEHLPRVLADVDRARERAGSEISLLREYRTRLIADVVTGKLDVREAAARLPDEEEPEEVEEVEGLAEGHEGLGDGDLDVAPGEAEA